MGDTKPGGGPTAAEAREEGFLLRESTPLMLPEESPANPGMDPEVRDEEDAGIYGGAPAAA